MRYALLALAALTVACLFAGCTSPSAREAEMRAWGSTAQLDLPANVSRHIIPTGATFTFTPEGDEKYVLIRTWRVLNWRSAYHDEITCPEPEAPITFSSGAVFYEDGFGLRVTAPDAQLDLVRENGSVESYLLPVRGGVVKG